MRLVEGLRLRIGYVNQDIIDAICKVAHTGQKNINSYEIVRESIDARRKPQIYYNVNVAVEFRKTNVYIDNLKEYCVSHEGIKEEICISDKGRPVIIGFGPAGMFMALKLAKCGLKPIIIEQGDTVERRKN